MKEQLSILLVEDDPMACDAFRSYVDTQDHVILSKITNNAYGAIDYVKANLPHAVILDLELTAGSGNGLDFLHRLQDPSIPYRPFVVITTNNSSSTIYQHAHNSGADFILYKHQEDYSAKMVIDFLVSLKEDIMKQFSKGIPVGASVAQEKKRQAYMRNRMVSELDHLGMSPKSKGYQYLVDAILLYTDNPAARWSYILANQYKKSETSIERAMQNAIKRTWVTSDTEDLYHYYTGAIRSDKGFPTLMEFISYYSNSLRRDFEA